MYILAIETTGPVGSVAVIDADGANKPDQNLRVPMKVTTRAMSHLKNLIPMASELLSEEKIGKDEICAVAASVGPGSFTGIRIGVSTARALAQAWDVPCISVPTLELFREKCANGDDAELPLKLSGKECADGSAAGSNAVCVIFNARRGQVYGACYSRAGGILIEPGPYMLADMLDSIEEQGAAPVFYGDGVDAYFDTDEFRGRVSGYGAAPEDERYQTADMTARYALAVWNREREYSESTGTERREHGKVVPYGKLLPDYMRESEAEQRLKDGSLEKMRKAKMERFMKMAGKQF